MVSVIICTYNRSEILQICLNSIANFIGSNHDLFEFNIIDNNSIDNTKYTVYQFKENNPTLQINYFLETNQGLSFSRNTGARNSKNDWLFYLDDDGLVIESTFNVLINTIQNYDFDIFGGVYTALYLSEKPNWLSEDFGTKKVIAKKTELINEDYIEGGIMVLKKLTLIELGFFNTRIGMMGNNLMYGEEADLIARAKKLNYKIGINPFFKIEHIVANKKYKLKHHFYSIFAQGRDLSFLNEKLNLPIARTLLFLPIRFIKYFLKFLFKKDFYYQNLLWYSFNNTIYIIGFSYGHILKIFKNRLSHND